MATLKRRCQASRRLKMARMDMKTFQTTGRASAPNIEMVQTALQRKCNG